MAAKTGAEAGWFARVPWLLNLLQSFETKPVFAGGFATGLCALLLFGAVMAQRPELAAHQAILQPASQRSFALLASAAATPLTPPVNQFLVADNSTNPVINFQTASSVSLRQMPVSAQFASFPVRQLISAAGLDFLAFQGGGFTLVNLKHRRSFH